MDEDPFQVAPSQRVEEEERSDGELRRRDRRSKAAHDRPAEASILILSIFAYLCEAYIGVRP